MLQLRLFGKKLEIFEKMLFLQAIQSNQIEKIMAVMLKGLRHTHVFNFVPQCSSLNIFKIFKYGASNKLNFLLKGV